MAKRLKENRGSVKLLRVGLLWIVLAILIAVLAIVAINSVLGAYNALLQLMNSDNLTGVLAFMNGSLAGMSWTHAGIILSYSIMGLLLSLLCIRHANALQLGDEMAKNLGVRVNGARIALSAPSAFSRRNRKSCFLMSQRHTLISRISLKPCSL